MISVSQLPEQRVLKEKHHKKGKYTIISSEILNSPKLSGCAKAVLLFMLGHSSNFRFNFPYIQKSFKEGTWALRAMLKELESYKFLIRQKARDAGGKIEWVYVVSETPIDSGIFFKEPSVDKPSVDKPSAANHSVNSVGSILLPGPGAEPQDPEAPVPGKTYRKKANSSAPPIFSEKELKILAWTETGGDGYWKGLSSNPERARKALDNTDKGNLVSQYENAMSEQREAEWAKVKAEEAKPPTMTLATLKQGKKPTPSKEEPQSSTESQQRCEYCEDTDGWLQFEKLSTGEITKAVRCDHNIAEIKKFINRGYNLI